MPEVTKFDELPESIRKATFYDQEQAWVACYNAGLRDGGKVDDRRFVAACAAMRGLVSRYGNANLDRCVEESVSFADALVAALEKEGK